MVIIFELVMLKYYDCPKLMRLMYSNYPKAGDAEVLKLSCLILMWLIYVNCSKVDDALVW